MVARFVIPSSFKGKYVTLRQICSDDTDELTGAGKGVDWTWMSSQPENRLEMENWVKERISDMDNGRAATFVVLLNPSEEVVGSTSLMELREKDKGLEIGRTWYSPHSQGTKVNPECKYILLSFAFDVLGAIRVQLKTDHMNFHSQNAIKKLGAVYEGELRNHMIRRDGTIRHTRMYSIIREEWSGVKKRLEER